MQSRNLNNHIICSTVGYWFHTILLFYHHPKLLPWSYILGLQWNFFIYNHVQPRSLRLISPSFKLTIHEAMCIIWTISCCLNSFLASIFIDISLISTLSFFFFFWLSNMKFIIGWTHSTMVICFGGWSNFSMALCLWLLITLLLHGYPYHAHFLLSLEFLQIVVCSLVILTTPISCYPWSSYKQ